MKIGCSLTANWWPPKTEQRTRTFRLRRRKRWAPRSKPALPTSAGRSAPHGVRSPRQTGRATRSSGCIALRQCHQALLDNVEGLRQILIHEVGAPIALTAGPQLESPIDIVGWYADLLAFYEFSEDLGVREVFGDEYVITGHKVWTSHSDSAQWCLMLARTDPAVFKHRGISAFAVRMSQPGIEQRPLKMINGVTREFGEVLFDGHASRRST